MRRQKQFLITGEKLWEILGVTGPDDARIRGARYDTFGDVVTFVVESDGFPEVEEGAEPEMMP